MDQKYRVKITNSNINIHDSILFCQDSKCGAIVTFTGTTRDNFMDKQVKTLSYECFEEMALNEMLSICEEANNAFPGCHKIYLEHKLGEVPVKEISVVCTVSSEHREEGFECCKWIMSELKKRVPIWKKEVFIDNSSIWKENKEYFD